MVKGHDNNDQEWSSLQVEMAVKFPWHLSLILTYCLMLLHMRTGTCGDPFFIFCSAAHLSSQNSDVVCNTE